jgi:ribosomal protein S18 acetylase RimI-like enzyme
MDIELRRGQPDDAGMLTPLARQTFVESHGHSASAEDILQYMERKLTEDILRDELADAANWFTLAFLDGMLAGYAKIIFNQPHKDIAVTPVAKLERIYTLASVHGRGVGQALWDHQLDLARQHGQKGIWLYTWTENHRAIAFYRRNGMVVAGRHDFEISATHSNPNHLMWLDFSCVKHDPI